MSGPTIVPGGAGVSPVTDSPAGGSRMTGIIDDLARFTARFATPAGARRVLAELDGPTVYEQMLEEAASEGGYGVVLGQLDHRLSVIRGGSARL